MAPTTKISERSATSASGQPVAVLAFTGDIASTSKDAILEAYGKIAPSIRFVLLDFSHVEYINSSGIAVIIQLLLQAAKTGQNKISLFGLSSHFTKVFNMVGVAKYAAMYSDESAALAAL